MPCGRSTAPLGDRGPIKRLDGSKSIAVPAWG
jgi:hypothetical protein